MPLSALTTIPGIVDPSDATPGLWNSRYSMIQRDLDQLNADASGATSLTVLGFSTNTLRPESGSTVSLIPTAVFVANSVQSGGGTWNVLGFGANPSGAAASTTAFVDAMSMASGGGIVYAPAGTYVVDNVGLANGVLVRGDGPSRTTIMIATGGSRAFAATSVTSTGVEGMTISAGSATATAFVLRFDAVRHPIVRHVEIIRAPDTAIDVPNSGHGIFDDIAISRATSWGFNFSGGSFHRITNIRGSLCSNRLVVLQNVAHCQLDNLSHFSSGGEVLLYGSGSSYNQATNILGEGIRSDGCAFDSGCSFNEMSNVIIRTCLGHGVSFDGAAQYNTLNNVLIDTPDEGGVIITNQGVAADVPIGNVVNNAVVRNASTLTSNVEQSFAVVGGRRNLFINCHSIDDRSPVRVQYGYLEQDGAGTAQSNFFLGTISGSSTSDYLQSGVGVGVVLLSDGSQAWRMDGAWRMRSGTAILPPLAFFSEASLGFYRSGVSTVALSYGTLNLASQGVRLSVRTASSLDSTNLAVNEMAFSLNASGASLGIRSGGTVWYLTSSASTVG